MVGAAGIESTLNRLRIAVVVLHVVGENHELGDVGKAPEFGILKALVDAVALGQYAFPVVGLFHLNKDQRHTVDQ
ncbi:hypothetical protein D9M69_457700 [compost metagenome]